MLRQRNLIVWLAAAVLITSAAAASAQTKRRKTAKKPVAAASKTETAPVQPKPVVMEAPKKNERPDNGGSAIPGVDQDRGKPKTVPPYFYEFSQPDFIVSKIVIEHDEAGKGTISFVKKGSSESISDPIEVSAASLERINKVLTALDFVNSNENYQYEKDYSHLGTTTFRIKKDARERIAIFNWTENKNARILADEYRRISNQFIWIFDITVARENQPLESPRLMDSLYSLIKRNEISDPKQLIPLLQGLTNDERIPLIARNHAAKLIKQIEKEKK